MNPATAAVANATTSTSANGVAATRSRFEMRVHDFLMIWDVEVAMTFYRWADGSGTFAFHVESLMGTVDEPRDIVFDFVGTRPADSFEAAVEAVVAEVPGRTLVWANRKAMV